MTINGHEVSYGDGSISESSCDVGSATLKQTKL